MNNILHYNKDKNHLVNTYYIALIPLLLFSFYKNGILLYQNDFISFWDMFLPFYFYIIGGLVGFLVAWISKRDIKEFVLYGLILSCTISINTNMIVYPILMFVSLFVSSYLSLKKEFNILASTRLFLLLALLLNSYSYLNVAEKLNAFNYGVFDLFFGYGVGGIASNGLFFVLLAFLILSFNKFYKKIIPMVASLVFFAFFLFLFLITKNISYLDLLVNGSVYFGFVFVGADLYVTPSTKKGMTLYGTIIGLLTTILALFLPIYEVAYLSIFLCSFFVSVFDRFFEKKYLHC